MMNSISEYWMTRNLTTNMIHRNKARKETRSSNKKKTRVKSTCLSAYMPSKDWSPKRTAR